MKTTTIEVAKSAKQSSLNLLSTSISDRKLAIEQIHQSLLNNQQEILDANSVDLNLAKGNTSEALLSRLDLSKKFNDMCREVEEINKLPDLIDRVLDAKELSDGLRLYKVSCPLGVILVIFEARPEVVVQVSCLALKSGNAVLLKGGKEAMNTNRALFECIQKALKNTNIPPDAVQLVETRDEISALLSQDKYIDLVIPRGSNALVSYVKSNTHIPVLGHADGICSVYVEPSADIQMSVKVIVDGKTNYPAACNATEKVLIHSDALKTHLIPIVKGLLSSQVLIHMDETCLSHCQSHFQSEIEQSRIIPSTQQDFQSEYLTLEICILSIPSLQLAIDHINTFGSHHTDGILTSSPSSVTQFMKCIDSAGVYHNSSTRFADGGRYGLGSEVGVSTNKIHARGPVGLEGLMGYKYRMYGGGHVVAGWAGKVGEIDKVLPDL